jgi:putative chitinase
MRRLLLAVGLAALATSVATGTALARDHTVRQGQTLSAIARRYHVSVGALASANGLSESTNLRVGQILQIPEQGVVFVREGQTLSHIARRHGVTIRELARSNRLREDATLRVG